MRMKLFLAAVAIALAASSPRRPATARRSIPYAFVGQLTAAPSERRRLDQRRRAARTAALRAMLGQLGRRRRSAYGDATEFLQWTDGIPTVVEAGDLAAGDYVRVNVRAPRGSSLDDDRAARPRSSSATTARSWSSPTSRDYLFRGTLTSVGVRERHADTSRGGNRRALRLLIGQSTTQTFTVGGSTIFLLWQGKVPTVITLSKLVAGDRIVVRIRAEARSTLAQVEATAAATGRRPRARTPRYSP